MSSAHGSAWRRILPGVVAALVFSLAGGGPARAEGDAAAGEKVFRACAACHSVEAGKHKIGPSLFGVVGRTPGTADAYKYSDAMKAFGQDGKVWDDAVLAAYLGDPRGIVKGTRMAFPGLKAAGDRENVIAYLKSKAR